jgi:hypothetical protein
MEAITGFSAILSQHGPMGLMLVIAMAVNIWLVRFLMDLHVKSEERMRISQEAHLQAMAQIVSEVRESNIVARANDEALKKELSELRSNVKDGACRYTYPGNRP